jgi:hypothetical protein
MNDTEAYYAYPHHRMWFSKLYVAELFDYNCGPCGTAPKEDGVYVVRPIYNLSGMGVGASVKNIKAGDVKATPPGYFWCEYLRGKHYSANYRWEWDRDKIHGKWVGTSCWEGINMPVNLTKFVEWKRSTYIPDLPSHIESLADVKEINVEFKGDSIIEVHLRASPDPDYDHIIPVWRSDGELNKVSHYIDEYGYKFIRDEDDADGHLTDPRIGFLVK